jgi:NAD(P)-dependent dehydrogenase (short-subunit alcohol dehydrogenase family)
MIEACVSGYDRIDVLDNNVGIAEVGGLVEVSEADWDRVFAVNLKSAYLTMKQTIPLMVRQGGGSIINISSIASIRYTGVPYATYYASKAALDDPMWGRAGNNSQRLENIVVVTGIAQPALLLNPMYHSLRHP